MKCFKIFANAHGFFWRAAHPAFLFKGSAFKFLICGDSPLHHSCVFSRRKKVSLYWGGMPPPHVTFEMSKVNLFRGITPDDSAASQ